MLCYNVMLIYVTVLILNHDLFSYFHIGNVSTQTNNSRRTGSITRQRTSTTGSVPPQCLLENAVDCGEDGFSQLIRQSTLLILIALHIECVAVGGGGGGESQHTTHQSLL